MIARVVYIILICLFSLGIRAQVYQLGDLVFNGHGEKGVVFWLSPDGTHGWAVGLQDVPAPSGWGPSQDIPGLSNCGYDAATMTHCTQVDTSGYTNTKIIRDFLGPGTMYPAQVVDFDKGWYIPAKEQLSILSAALVFIEQSIADHGGTLMYHFSGIPMPDEGVYFSSSEYDESTVWYYDTYFYSLEEFGKDIPGSVRPIFTFYIGNITSDTTLTYLWNTGHTDPIITQQPTEPTTYTLEVTSKAGCSVTAEKQIFVADGNKDTIHARICKGEIYRENGFEESEPGSYTRTLPGPGGCDVSVTLELTVGEPDTTRLPPATICEGERYTEHHFYVFEAGEHIRRWQRPGQCDSVVILNLAVTPLVQEVLYDTVCYGETYRENGLDLSRVTAPGTHYLPWSASVGCDTSVTLHLAVNPVLRTTLFDTLRFGNTYSENGFYIANVVRDGVYTNVEPSSCRCDSVSTLYLTVQAYTNDTTLYDTACAGESYNRYGFFLSNVKADTVLKATLTNRSGLDSLVTLHLTTAHPSEHRYSASVCAGESFSDANFTLPILYRDTSCILTLQTVHGCDSVIYLEITVRQTTTRTFQDMVVYGGEYNNHGFTLQNVTKDSVYRDTVKTVSGIACDSIITVLDLKVVRNAVTELFDTICYGNRYNNHGFALPPLYADTDTTKVIPLTPITDSVVTLHITVSSFYLFESDTTICPGEQVDFRGRWVDLPGIYTDSLLTASGCDSIYRLTLRWYPVWEHRDTLTLCAGDTLRWNGQAITAPGTYTAAFSSVHGCDSTEIAEVYPAWRFNGTIGILLDDCETYTYLFTADGNTNDIGLHPVYRWDFGDGNFAHETEPLYSYADSGLYRIALQVYPESGCDTTLYGEVAVEYYPEDLTLYFDRTVATPLNPEIRFWTDLFAGMEYEWDFGDGSRGSDAVVTHRYDVSKPQSYTVRLTVTNRDACIVEREITIQAEPRQTEEYQFPAVFSPNGDGINDTWEVKGLWQDPGNTLEIYNRAQQQVYRASPYLGEWNGTTEDGTILPAGTYIYKLTTGKQLYIGMVSIVRN